jgi:isopentenyldiphosphate isomerase
MPADDEAELFAIVDPVTGEDTGERLPRAIAHATGAWHRAVHVCVWRPSDGALLLQRRAAAKAVCPGAWDLSAAEHVRPGEAGRAAALRGLAEELGLGLGCGGEGGGEGGEAAALTGPGPARTQVTADAAAGLLDREVVETWHVRGGWGGEVVELEPDPAEVCALRWCSLAALAAEVGDRPDAFTPWLLGEGRAQGWW